MTNSEINPEITIVLFYKYVQIDNPESIRLQQLALCQELGLKGRTIIAEEGINATLAGSSQNVQKYLDFMNKQDLFHGIHWKLSKGIGSDFPRLSIKVRHEIVSAHLGSKDLNPNQVTGKYIQAEELHEWFRTGKKFYLVDMRNDYEQLVGTFDKAILSNFTNFRDLPSILPSLESLKNQTIVTFCTGGIRCEKASGFLVQSGFNDVYQLYGGIVTYMEKYPNKDFLGKLYVFDKRVVMGFNTNSPEHVVIGKCQKCESSSENFVNCTLPSCHKHFICCRNCYSRNGFAFCNKVCELEMAGKLEKVAV
jgi:UPF0176 protein